MTAPSRCTNGAAGFGGTLGENTMKDPGIRISFTDERQEGAQPHARRQCEAHGELRDEERGVGEAHDCDCSRAGRRKVVRRSRKVAMLRLTRFHAMPFTKAA